MYNYRITVRGKGTIESKGISPTDAFEKKFSNITLVPIEDAFNANVCIELLNGKKQSRHYYVGTVKRGRPKSIENKKEKVKVNGIANKKEEVKLNGLSPIKDIIKKFNVAKAKNNSLSAFEYEDESKKLNPFKIEYSYQTFFCVGSIVVYINNESKSISDTEVVKYCKTLFNFIDYKIEFYAKENYTPNDAYIGDMFCYKFNIKALPKMCTLTANFDLHKVFALQTPYNPFHIFDVEYILEEINKDNNNPNTLIVAPVVYLHTLPIKEPEEYCLPDTGRNFYVESNGKYKRIGKDRCNCIRIPENAQGNMVVEILSQDDTREIGFKGEWAENIEVWRHE